MEYISISISFDTEIKAHIYKKHIPQWNTDYPIPFHTGNTTRN